MNYDGGLSASDVALLQGRNNNDGFGDGNGWWIIIFLIFALGGWGNGFGGYGNNGAMGAADNYVLASDFAQLSRQVDSGFDRLGNRIENVNNGICDGFYAMNTGMLNGFGNVQQTLCAGFGGITNAINSQGYETRLGTQALGSQLASCCCDIRQELADCCCKTQTAIQGINYNMAMNTRDLIENQNANYRALHDEIVANRIEDKNAQIQAQQNEINALRLAASQEKQNNYLVEKLNPNVCPVPAYLTCNPNAPLNYSISYGNCGCNNGCGC